jgi:hypothetical protein
VLDASRQLLTDVVQHPLTDSDANLWFTILHNCVIHLRPGGLSEESTVLAPLTRRAAGEVIASLWPKGEDHRGTYIHWYFEVPYEVLSDVPHDLLPRLAVLRESLTKHPKVLAVVEDV